MTRTLRLGLYVTMLAFALTAAPAESDETTIVNAATPNATIGPVPDMNPAEYVPYTKKGDNVLAFPWYLHLSNGMYHPCSEHDYAVLYPETTYTRWLIQRFALDTVGHNKREGRLFPGDRGFAVVAPSFLQPFSKDTVVRMASCNNGWIAFPHLPLGNWIAVGAIVDFRQGGSPAMQTVPDVAFDPALGLLEESSRQVYDLHSTYDITVGGYLMISAPYHIGADSTKPSTDTKVYAFGKFAQ